MFEIMKNSPWNDMWKAMDAFMQYPTEKRTLETNGLKSMIHRPHNIINVKDEDGNVVAQRLEVVTTPFAKDDVTVTVQDNTLSVECGNKKQEEPCTCEGDTKECQYVYRGISTQKYTFALRLGDNIDTKGIKAKNSDGMLTVTLPFRKEEPKEVMKIEVE